MIKNVFIPEKIGTYYLFPQTIVGIDITKTHLYACKVLIKGNSLTVENYFEQGLETGTSNNQHERTVDALKALLQAVGSYDSIYASIPGPLAIFKTLKLPFSEYEKVKMVVAYEIEPLLPFPLTEAQIDFVITEVFENGSSQVLVVAVQKHIINEHSALFEQAQTTLSCVTVDTLSLYHVYKRIFAQNKQNEGVVLLDYRMYETRLIYIYNGNITLMRNLSKGLFDQARDIASKINISPAQALEKLLRFGIENSDDHAFLQASTQVLDTFLDQISFTMRSFVTQAALQDQIQKIIILGKASEIKGITSVISKKLHIPVTLLPVNELLYDQQIIFKNNSSVPINYATSFGTTLAALEEHPVNLLTTTLTASSTSLLLKQLVTALALTVVLFVGFISYSYYQTGILKNEAAVSGEQAIKSLQKAFDNTLKIKGETIDRRLNDAVKKADKAVDEKEKLWFSFAESTRKSFLQYLLELTTKLDKEGLGLSVERIGLSQDTLNLKGSVKTYEATALLKQILRQSKLFGTITPPGELEKLSFNIDIELKNNAEGEE